MGILLWWFICLEEYIFYEYDSIQEDHFIITVLFYYMILKQFVDLFGEYLRIHIWNAFLIQSFYREDRSEYCLHAEKKNMPIQLDDSFRQAPLAPRGVNKLKFISRNPSAKGNNYKQPLPVWGRYGSYV